MSQPKNWPGTLPYLKAPLHSKDLAHSHLAAIRTKPSLSSDIPILPASETATPCPRVKIQPISTPSHPAHGQSGLFAAQNLKPGAFILAYLGRVHSSAGTSAASDYDLWLDRDADVAVDAAREGNEARFVNDYRGVGPRANAEFRPAFCERWGELCIGVWVLGAGAGAGKKRTKEQGIRKGEEILVSYGKGFWEERRRELEDGKATEEDSGA
ncbi:hypothetical protein V2A60_006558 [Cordyceps javanica]